MDIHNYKRRLERTLNKIKNSSLSQGNKDLILQFHNHCFAEGLSPPKIERYLYDIHRYAGMLGKDVTKATKQDIQGIVAEIEKKEWSPHTKHSFKVALRKFYKWNEGIDERGVYPERVKWLHSNVKNSQTKLPEDMLTEEEIKGMISQADNARDRALIALLYESGCRISEVGLLQIKSIHSDDYGVLISVVGKTGPRRVRLIACVPFLHAWLNKHPDNKNPENFVWVSSKCKILRYTRLVDIIKNLAVKSGMRKRIYPHLFRHSRATYLAKHLTEAQIKAYLGWTQSSKMAAIYVHLSGRDTDQAILKLNGVKISEDSKELELKPKLCVRCNAVNECTNIFCFKCGMVIDEKEKQEIIRQDLKRKEADTLMNDLMRDKEFLALMLKKIQEKAGQVQETHL